MKRMMAALLIGLLLFTNLNVSVYATTVEESVDYNKLVRKEVQYWLDFTEFTQEKYSYYDDARILSPAFKGTLHQIYERMKSVNELEPMPEDLAKIPIDIVITEAELETLDETAKSEFEGIIKEVVLSYFASEILLPVAEYHFKQVSSAGEITEDDYDHIRSGIKYATAAYAFVAEFLTDDINNEFQSFMPDGAQQIVNKGIGKVNVVLGATVDCVFLVEELIYEIGKSTSNIIQLDAYDFVIKGCSNVSFLNLISCQFGEFQFTINDDFTVTIGRFLGIGKSASDYYDPKTGRNVLLLQGTYHDYPIKLLDDEILFNNNFFNEVVVGDEIVEVGYQSTVEYVIDNCPNITSVTIGKNVTEITNFINEAPYLKEINYNAVNAKSSSCGNNIDRFYAVFANCGYGEGITTKLNFGEGVTQLPQSFLYNVALEEDFVVPKSVKTVNRELLTSCSTVKSVNLGENTQRLNDNICVEYVISNCRNLESITIGEKVKDLGHVADNCPILSEINYNAISAESHSSYYYGGTSYCTFRNCGNNLTDEYTNFNIGTNVKVIPSDFFCKVKLQKDIVIPDSVETVEGAFLLGCHSVKTIHFGNNVRTLEDFWRESYMVANCYGIEEITIGEKTEKISLLATNCTNLKQIRFNAINAVNGKKSSTYTLIHNCNNNQKGIDIVFGKNVKSVPNYFINTSNVKVNNFYCYKNSVAEQYAITNNFTYILLDNYCFHDETIAFDGYEATCTETGMTSGIKCAECGVILEGGETVQTTAHKYKEKVVKATITKNGSVKKVCDCGKVGSSEIVYHPKNIKLSAVSYVYNGKVKKPTIKLYDSKGKIINKENYAISYAKGRKNVGKYKVTVTFKSSSKLYKGSKATYFKINPKGTTINKVSKGTKAFVVSWKKQSGKMATTRITGYQIRYSESSKMTNSKYKIVRGYSNISKKVTGLKANKKYYVQIRTFKTISGKKYYSSWSKYKTVITK